MSESDEHRELVVHLARHFQRQGSRMNVMADLPVEYGYRRPPDIRGYLPDVLAEERDSGLVLVGEAKTRLDLNTARSEAQIAAFLSHVNEQENGMLFVACFGSAATRAKTLLRFLLVELGYARNTVRVYDGLDSWTLAASGPMVWHLD